MKKVLKKTKKPNGSYVCLYDQNECNQDNCSLCNGKC